MGDRIRRTASLGLIEELLSFTTLFVQDPQNARRRLYKIFRQYVHES